MYKVFRNVLMSCAVIAASVALSGTAASDCTPRPWRVSDSFRLVSTSPVDIHEKSYPDLLCDAYDHIGKAIVSVEDALDYGMVSALSMTTGLRDEITEALSATLAPWLVTEEVINLAIIIPLTQTTDIWRVEQPGSMQYIAILALRIDDAYLMLVASPESGLVEAVVLADYNDIDSFEQAAGYYFNLSGYDAEPDYRPVNTFPTAGGWFRPRPECDYAWQGYIVTLDEPERQGFVRSFSRDYFTLNATTDLEGGYRSIEFSLKYAVSE